MADERDILVWRRANDLLRQAERIHRNFLQMAARAHYGISHGHAAHWEPSVNVVETDDSLWVISALPGVVREQLKVYLEGDELVIAGERPMPECCQNGELKIWEIPLGTFERRLKLVNGPKRVSVGDSSLRDGLLIIELRKQS